MSGGLPTGVQRKHSRKCPAHADKAARCTRKGCNFQVQAGPRTSRRTATFDNVRDAARWKAEMDLRFSWRRGSRRMPTVREAGDEWIDEMRAGRALSNRTTAFRDTTVRGYVRELRGPVYERLGDRRLDDVTRGDVLALIGDLQREGRAPATVRNVLVPLRTLFRYAQDHGWVLHNPTRGVTVADVSRSRREEFVPAAGARALLAALPERDRPLWATAFYAGLRRGELMGLRWEDVDLGAAEIHVRRSYSPAEGRIVDTKTVGSRRTVPVPGVLLDELRAHHERRGDAELVFARGSLAGSCRRGKAGEPFADQAVGERARAAWEAAGLEPVSLHVARHSYASMLVAAGVSQKRVQWLLGHSALSTTDIYVHDDEPGAAEDVARLDSHVRAAAEG